MYLTDGRVTIRPITTDDLPHLWAMTCKEEWPEWKNWDAPYFPHKQLSYEEYIALKEQKNRSRESRRY